ncbi:MAG: DUF3012 domain-containing protein [Alteromonadaceae bacterium]|nr:MAG: DUF3012 domain-containing protein [Alteromonadaceae bacterium]
MKKTITLALLSTALIATLASCTPEVGSEEWCKNLKDKPKGDWTVNELTDFTKHCVFK